MAVTITENNLPASNAVELPPNVFQPDQEISVLVVGESYDRHGGGGTFNTTYTGPAWEVFQMISERHSYDSFEGSETWDEVKEDNDLTSINEMIDSIENQNGDGCDYIETMTELTTSTHLID